MTRRVFACVVAAGLAAILLVDSTLDRASAPTPAPSGAEQKARLTASAPPTAVAPAPTARDATSAMVDSTAAPEGALEARLRSALLSADKGARGSEVLDARRLLAQVLRHHPHLAPVMAKELGELTNRELAFQVGRLLGRHLSAPGVRSALLEHVVGGAEVPREAAIYAIYSDPAPASAAALASAFLDPSANARVRTAAGCGLPYALEALAREDLERVRAQARDLADDRRANPELRAEALDLLPVSEPGERARLRALLQPGTPARVQLASARLLLSAGEPPEPIRAALGSLAQEDSLSPMARDSLSALLDR